MKKTVFISSTYEDLQEERRLVWDSLEKFEVNVRGMEHFGARTESPLETCLTEVEISDIYIGILAFRLGSIESVTRKSFTQLEYERAYEQNKEILIYMIDKDKAKILVKFIDKDERREKLEAFKSILKERHTVATYYSPQDLIEKLERDFRRLLQSKKVERTDLDEYSQVAEVIKKFLLVPKELSGKDVRLKIKMRGDPFPASKEVCSSLNLDFGATIGIRIQIDKPANLENIGIDILYLNAKQMDDLAPLHNGEEREIYAKLQFTPSRIDRFGARFKTDIKFTQPTYIDLSSNALEKAVLGEKTILEPDGLIALLLTRNIK